MSYPSVNPLRKLQCSFNIISTKLRRNNVKSTAKLYPKSMSFHGLTCAVREDVGTRRIVYALILVMRAGNI